MTFEELNSVCVLQRQLKDELQKIQALRDCVESITQKYSRETLTHPTVKGVQKSYTALDISPKGGAGDSKIENFVIMIVDSEKKVANLQMKIRNEMPLLVRKIQNEFSITSEQTILIYRYVLCKSLRDTAKILHYSKSYVCNVHSKILKMLSQWTPCELNGHHVNVNYQRLKSLAWGVKPQIA